ncbi:MAG: hypothetical protein D6726_07920 [Nitrospirae bacterium]|nr:MAG: hypothetical protein D6726_07920 [Nitrospirota bacterium]
MVKNIYIFMFAVVIAFLSGYALHYAQFKGVMARAKGDDKVKVILICGESQYETEIDAYREKIALEILGLKTKWEEKK